MEAGIPPGGAGLATPAAAAEGGSLYLKFGPDIYSDYYRLTLKDLVIYLFHLIGVILQPATVYCIKF